LLQLWGVKKEARKLGYAATTITAKELTKVGSPNFATALYGKAPGVRINTNQGGSIVGVSINIRGLNSITGGGQPLIVMNGVPIRNGGTGSGTDAMFAEFGAESRVRSNGLVDINPEDIENLYIRG
jgi:outer membrane receptor for Fe3+-dicitrate